MISKFLLAQEKIHCNDDKDVQKTEKITFFPEAVVPQCNHETTLLLLYPYFESYVDTTIIITTLKKKKVLYLKIWIHFIPIILSRLFTFQHLIHLPFGQSSALKLIIES